MVEFCLVLDFAWGGYVINWATPSGFMIASPEPFDDEFNTEQYQEYLIYCLQL